MLSRKTLQVPGTLTLLILCSCGLQAQDNPAAARARALNNALLNLHGQMQRATPNEAALLHSQAVNVIAERAAALSALIQQDARQGLSFAFSPELLADLAAKFPASAGLLESHGTWTGLIEYWISDDAKMNRHQSMRLMKKGQQTLQVYFAGPEPKGLKSGDLLEASGILVGTTLAASGGTVTGTSLPAASCCTTGPQNVAVLLVTFPGATLPTTVTPQSVHDFFFGTTGHSLDGYWREASYGQTSATGNVFGWYTLTGSYTCTNIAQMRDDAIAAASATGVAFQDNSRVFIVFPDTIGCGWSGMAVVGCTTLSAPTGSFTGSVSYLSSNWISPQDQGAELAIHEGGHNLGLQHASTRDFSPDALGPLGAIGTLTEYGDRFSAMSVINLGHYAAPHKAEVLNWLASGTNYQVVQSSGTYSLQPFEMSPAGLQALKVQRGTGNPDWVWIEYRQLIGNYDSTLPNVTLSTQAFSGALIHYEDSTTGIWTHLLDFTPGDGNWFNPALAAGQTWVDPYTNLSLSVQSATSSGLTVSVNYGTAPCAHANPSMTITPLDPSIYPGNSASYAISVTNNDAAACTSSTFNLGSSQPSGWPTSFSPSVVTLSPGQSGSATMSKTGPLGTPPGTYAVDASAANGSFQASGAANVTVMAPPPPLSVSVSVPGSSYARRSTVPVTATVLNGSNPAAGASVTFTLIKADGSRVAKTIIAGSAGTVTWSYRIGPKDPTGTDSVAAQAMYSSQTATSNTASFTVQ